MPSRRSNRWVAVLLLWFTAFVALLPPPVVQGWFAGAPNALLAVAMGAMVTAAALAAPEIGFVRALRWTLASAALVWTIRKMNPGLVTTDMVAGMSQVAALLGVVALIVLLAPELVRLTTWPAMKLIDSLIYPNERFKRPPLDFRLATFYVRRGLWEQAAEEYERILSYYPDNFETYEALLAIYTGPLPDRAAVRTLWRKARRRLAHHPRGVHQLKHKVRRSRTTQDDVRMDG